MINIDDEKLSTKYHDIKSYLTYYDKFGKPLVDEYSKTLDEKVDQITTYIKAIRERNLDFDVVSLQRICMELSSTIYYTTSRLEQVNLLADMAKVKMKDVYNEAFTSRQGAAKVSDRKYTNDQLKALAEQDSIEEELLNFIYSHAAAAIKAKIDSANEVLKSCSKSLSAQIQNMQSFGVTQKHM